MATFEDSLATVEALLNAYRVVAEALEESLRSEGLSLAQYEALGLLNRSPGNSLRMADITGCLRMSKSGATQLVDRLEESGLVVREFSRRDRRLTFATLTDRGRDVLRRATPAVSEAAREHLGRRLGDKELASLRTTLGRISEADAGRREAPAPSASGAGRRASNGAASGRGHLRPSPPRGRGR
ncbi:MAG: MarR family transcriptional regulator [Candidatus Dormibacteraeota bacterium]|nr:MarR family transcriptional regulator [Candidatus Dormibacteraeota bacterium]